MSPGAREQLAGASSLGPKSAVTAERSIWRLTEEVSILRGIQTGE